MGVGFDRFNDAAETLTSDSAGVELISSRIIEILIDLLVLCDMLLQWIFKIPISILTTKKLIN